MRACQMIYVVLEKLVKCAEMKSGLTDGTMCMATKQVSEFTGLVSSVEMRTFQFTYEVVLPH